MKKGTKRGAKREQKGSKKGSKRDDYEMLISERTEEG
jgi:hypothetical protein